MLVLRMGVLILPVTLRTLYMGFNYLPQAAAEGSAGFCLLKRTLTFDKIF